MTKNQVTFRWKDYRHGSQVRLMTLSAEEFLRRFCLHVLPKGFVRIRFYGFLAPRCRTEALARCRQALGAHPEPVPAASVDDTSTRVSLPPCPTCGGMMVAVERLTARQLAVQVWIEGLAVDSSWALHTVITVEPPRPGPIRRGVPAIPRSRHRGLDHRASLCPVWHLDPPQQ